MQDRNGQVLMEQSRNIFIYVECGILVSSFLKELPDARRRFLAELEEFTYSGSVSVNSRFLAPLAWTVEVGCISKG